MAKRERYLTWDEYFMSICFLSGERSKDPSTQVGACIVDKDNKICGVGYNGMPIGCPDDEMPWTRMQGETDESWLGCKTPYVCHAEMNAIVNKFNANISGCKMYVSLHPCNECAKMIVQSGITEVIYASHKYKHRKEFRAAEEILKKVGMKRRQFKPTENVEIDFEKIEGSHTSASTDSSDELKQ